MSNQSNDLPFRSDAQAAASAPGPAGALLPFRERGQAAPGGEMENVIEAPNALGHGNTFPANLKG